MKSLSFQTTRSVQLESGATGKVGQLMKDRGCRKVAFITDAMILKLGLADAALDSLKQAGLATWVFSEVVADPPETMILDAVARARDEGIDGVVSIGGGSSMDTAKLIAVLCNTDQPLSDMYGIGMVKGERLPLLLAPTTAGTGSEVTPISIVTTGAAEKKGVVSPQLLPDWALLDPDLTLGLPANVTAATGIDAMVHCIEAYTSKRLKNVIADGLAREGLKLLAANLRTVCETPRDVEARGNMLLGSMLAGMAFTNAPVAAVHALAYPLGGHFHVPHGLSNALVLPHVLAFNMPAAEALYAELAPLIFPDVENQSHARKIERMLSGIAALSPELGLESTLREVGVKEPDLAMLADDAMKQTRLLVNNPRELTREDALAIYTQAY